MHDTRREPAAGATSWARLLVVLAARAYRTLLLTLTAIAVAPLLLSWWSCVVASGSMQPSISVGDVVLVRPTEADDTVHVGRVYLFEDPSRPERQLVHRIVERRDDGGFTTAGDANQLTDSTPLTRGGIRGQAILLVPFVGLPVHWLRTGALVPFAAWLLLTVGAFVLATRGVEGDPPTRRPRSLRGRRPSDEDAGHDGRPGRRLVPVAAATALLIVGGATTGAADAGFTARATNGSNSWTAGAWVQPYVGEVLADRPFGFWLLDETRGAQYATDRSGNNRTGQYYGALDLGAAGGLPANPGTALTNDTGRVILGPQTVTAPTAYAVELWFRTTATSQSYLAGFEDDRDAAYSLLGTDADRAVTMESSGRLTFGTWPWRSQAITTPRAYNDGRWHHLVVSSTTQRATTIYVDGAAVVSGTTSTLLSYAGYWRIGQGSIGLFNTPAFRGDLDNVAIYHSPLSAARVAAHWAAR